MRIPQAVDLQTIKSSEPSFSLLHALAQEPDDQGEKENSATFFLDECFVVADGEGFMHGKNTADFAADTAIWGYKKMRQIQAYWEDKKACEKRLFNITNLAVWQKQKAAKTSGYQTTLTIVLTGAIKFWWAWVGDTAVYLYRDGSVKLLTVPERDDFGKLTNSLGMKRYDFDIIPHSEDFLDGDIVYIGSRGVSDYITEKEMVMIFSKIGKTQESLDWGARECMRIAKPARGNGSMCVQLIKRISTKEQGKK
jgi:serine/threonine protein phosphatase PrpC